jgi:alpha-1,3-fucosyltransferase
VVYGTCGVPCTVNDCREWIALRYKIFLMLKYDIIPVVIGGGNYSRFVPKSGYINGLDFKSAKDLGTYLNYLDSNKTAFNSYFKWKKHVNFLDYTVSYSYESLCFGFDLL